MKWLKKVGIGYFMMKIMVMILMNFLKISKKKKRMIVMRQKMMIKLMRKIKIMYMIIVMVVKERKIIEQFQGMILKMRMKMKLNKQRKVMMQMDIGISIIIMNKNMLVMRKSIIKIEIVRNIINLIFIISIGNLDISIMNFILNLR